MNPPKEEDLLFDFRPFLKWERFDDVSIHGTLSSMKRVDFIIEKVDHVIFLEVKDPDIPGAKNIMQFRQDFQGGSLIPELAGKYRDTLLFTQLRGGYEKPINYVVLLSMASLDEALILNRTDALKSSIPISHRQWLQDSVNSCVILKLDAYKRVYGDQSVWRHSDYED
jgi:hypothetical protein